MATTSAWSFDNSYALESRRERWPR
jgi:hypothetical protein